MATGHRLTVAIGVAAVATVGVLYAEPATVFETVPALAQVAVSVSTPILILGVAALVAVIVAIQRFSRLFAVLNSDGDSLVSKALERTTALEGGTGTTATPNEEANSGSVNERPNTGSRRAKTPLRQRSESDPVNQFGSEYDDWLEGAMNYDQSTGSRAQNRSELRKRLREEAVTGCQIRTSADTPTAQAVVDTGTWTEHPRAAGFLAEPAGRSIPIHLWLWDVLRGADPFEVAVEETLTALEAVYAGGATGSGADSDTVAVDLEAAIASVDHDAADPPDSLVSRLRARTNATIRGTSGD